MIVAVDADDATALALSIGCTGDNRRGSMSNIDTVKQIYAAFGRGDIPAILEKLDETTK